MHFTNKEYPYLDIAKGSSLLLVNSSDSSDNEENESDYLHRRGEYYNQYAAAAAVGCAPKTKDPFHDPSPSKSGNGGSDIVDELLKPLQSYFNIYRTGQYGNHQVDGATADQVKLLFTFILLKIGQIKLNLPNFISVYERPPRTYIS